MKCEQTIFKGRKAVRLGNDVFEVITLTGGGHIASLRLPDSNINPLWEPPWPSIEPEQYNEEEHVEVYGTGEGRLLSSLAGHSLCLNHFGDLSDAEVAAKGYFHGEASNLPWTIFELSTGNGKAFLDYGLELPDAHMDFRRVLEIRPGESTLYFNERTTNTARHDSPLFYQQHVTYGPPFVQGGVTQIYLPARRGHTFPSSIDESDPYLPNKEFEWPKAPLQTGDTRDLRVFPDKRYMSVLSVLLEPELEYAFTAVWNADHGLLVLYVFPWEIFPWTALWYENQAAEFLPYNNRTIAWGIEFGTVPSPINRMDTLTAGPLFDKPRFATLAAKETLDISYQVTLLKIPENWQGVAGIQYEQGEIIVREVGSSRTINQTSNGDVSARRI